MLVTFFTRYLMKRRIRCRQTVSMSVAQGHDVCTPCNQILLASNMVINRHKCLRYLAWLETHDMCVWMLSHISWTTSSVELLEFWLSSAAIIVISGRSRSTRINLVFRLKPDPGLIFASNGQEAQLTVHFQVSGLDAYLNNHIVGENSSAPL
jgi:hypothetical protein